MNMIRNWYLQNQQQITWFLIGVLTLQGINELARGEWGQAALSFSIAGLNYAFQK